MDDKKLSRNCRIIAIALMIGGVYLFQLPSKDPVSNGYASLDSSVPTMDKLTQFSFEEEEEQSDEPEHVAGTTLTKPTMNADKNAQTEHAQSQQKNVMEPKTSQKKMEEEPQQQETKVVTEEIITEPQEETVVYSNTQYIGNSGMVFMSYEEAEAYAKQQMMDYPDTTQSYEIKESWELPVDGSRQYTIDFIFVS